jgi:1,4-alpha-glucan branching enzyme
MDSLRYWVTEMHVDGFRFDLASTLARQFHEVDRIRRRREGAVSPLSGCRERTRRRRGPSQHWKGREQDARGGGR